MADNKVREGNWWEQWNPIIAQPNCGRDGAPSRSETIEIDKELFKQLLKLVLNIPDLGGHIATVNINTAATTTDEIFIRLEPTKFFLRLEAALRACG